MIEKRYGLDLTEGRISTLLVRFAAPFAAANLISALYGIVGMLVVGRYTDSATISGVATGTQIMSLMFSFIMGLGTGGTVIIGRCIGMKDNKAGTKAVGSFFIVTAGLIVFLTLFIWFGRGLMIDLLKTQPQARPSALRYVEICAIGVPFNLGYGMLSAVFRGMGNSNAPSVVAAISCVVNVVLSFILVAGMGMAEAGVAAATSAAQIVSFVLIAVWLYRKRLPFPFAKSNVKPDRASMSYIFLVGLPIVLQELLITLSFMIITNRVNSISVEASAAVGVVARAMNVAFVIPLGIGSAISAMAAQNLGAGKRDRSLSALKWGILYSVAIGIAVMLTCLLRPESIAAFFAKDPDVIQGAAKYLMTYSIDAVMVAFIFCLNAYLSGCGKSKISMAHSLAATFAIRVPLSIYFSGLPETPVLDKLFFLGLAAPIASVFSIIVCIAYLTWYERKNRTLTGQGVS